MGCKECNKHIANVCICCTCMYVDVKMTLSVYCVCTWRRLTIRVGKVQCSLYKEDWVKVIKIGI